MKSILTKMLFLLTLAAVVGTLPAQGVKVLDGVLKLRLRNTGPIIENSEIKGYYMFYLDEKVSRGTFAYQLKILDADLNEVSTETITGPKSLFLAEGSYNGESIMLKFVNFKDDIVSLKRFGRDGKLIKSYDKEFGKWENSVYTQNSKEEIAGTSLHAVPGKGFVHYRFHKMKKFGYTIEYYPEEGKGWSISSSAESRMWEMSNFLGVSGDVLISSTLKKKNMSSRHFDNYILATNLRTGKQLFEKKMENAQYDIQVMNTVPDSKSGGIEMLGLFFKLGDNVMKDPSLGFCKIVLDVNGKMIDERYVSWADDVSEVMVVNERGKMKGMGFVYFHNMVTDDKGDIFLIGEQYKKTVSGAGVAVNVLSGGSNISNFQLTIDDLMIFHLSPEFEIKGVDIFEKSKTRVQLPSGAGLYGAQFLATYMNAFGAFDYSFTQSSPDRSVFTVGFVDWDKDGPGKN